MNNFLIPMNKKIIKEKNKSVYNYLKFLIYFFIFYLINNFQFLLTIGIILYFIKGNTLKKIITFVMAGFSSWFCHYMSHKIKYLNYISGHIYHHQDKTTFLEDLHEFLSDVFAAGLGLLILHYILLQFKINIFNKYVLLYFMISFPLVHLIIYHKILKQSYHQQHHEETEYNFSPDFFDHIFNKNLDHNIEDMSHMIPIFLTVGIFVILIQKYSIIKF